MSRAFQKHLTLVRSGLFTQYPKLPIGAWGLRGFGESSDENPGSLCKIIEGLNYIERARVQIDLRNKWGPIELFQLYWKGVTQFVTRLMNRVGICRAASGSVRVS